MQDYGVHDTSPSLYPDKAAEVAEAVAAGRHERAILMCGTGIGMCITANKVPGRKSNDAQVMALGARVVGEELAKSLVDTWLGSDFQGGSSVAKVERMKAIEERYTHAAAK